MGVHSTLRFIILLCVTIVTIKNANIYLKNVLLTLGQTRWEFFDFDSLFHPIIGEKFRIGCINSKALDYEWFINENEPSGVSITGAFGGSILMIDTFTEQFIGVYKCRANLNGSQEEIYLNITTQSELSIFNIIINVLFL